MDNSGEDMASYNTDTKRVINVFNQEGIQTFKYEENIADNYYLDNNGEKTLHNP